MRKIYNYILTACFALSATTCNAQIGLKQLINTKWKFVSIHSNGIIGTEDDSEDIETFWYFSKTNIKQTVHYHGRTVIHNFPYYITSMRPTSMNDFNNTLVGKFNKGKFLVMYMSTLECIDWYIIKSFYKTTGDMYLFRERVPDEIGGSDVTIHLKLIK